MNRMLSSRISRFFSARVSAYTEKLLQDNINIFIIQYNFIILSWNSYENIEKIIYEIHWATVHRDQIADSWLIFQIVIHSIDKEEIE